jgi:hypothetical protein
MVFNLYSQLIYIIFRNNNLTQKHSLFTNKNNILKYILPPVKRNTLYGRNTRKPVRPKYSVIKFNFYYL